MWAEEKGRKIAEEGQSWAWQHLRLTTEIRAHFGPLAKAQGMDMAKLEPMVKFAVMCSVHHHLTRKVQDNQDNWDAVHAKKPIGPPAPSPPGQWLADDSGAPPGCSRQDVSAAFQAFDQKSNQIYNMLVAVTKTMNDFRDSTIRNLL
jgi:hypothetical protein